MSKLMKSLNRLKNSVWGEPNSEKPENENASSDVKKNAENNDENDVSTTSIESRSPLSRKERRKLQKKKQQKKSVEEEESELVEEVPELIEEDHEKKLDLSRFEDSASDMSELEQDVEDEDEEEDEEEEDIPLSDVELDDDADVVPHQKETVNNRPALKQALATFALPKNSKFVEHMSITYPDEHEITDIYDDMQRELAFYKQALAAAKSAKKQCQKDDIPFSRPPDFFAEMLKSDEHMDRLKQKLIDEETAKKASQEARRQRELKKFGKKVQHAKLQERQKEKRDTMEKIKSLKRKRNNNEMQSEEFDIAIEEAAEFKPTKSSKRQAKDAKYGHGGKKRLKNKNDAESSADLSGFNSRNMKAGGQKSKSKAKRPGRNRRHNRR